MHTRAKGKIGEILAANYLKSRGYEILDANVAFRGGEIDLVTRSHDGGRLVFVEVKMRTGEAFGEGSESVGRLKMKRLNFAITRYLDKYALWSDVNYSIDIVDIALDRETGAVKKITHIEDIEA